GPSGARPRSDAAGPGANAGTIARALSGRSALVRSLGRGDRDWNRELDTRLGCDHRRGLALDVLGRSRRLLLLGLLLGFSGFRQIRPRGWRRNFPHIKDAHHALRVAKIDAPR